MKNKDNEIIFNNDLISPELISEEAFSSPLDDLIKSFRNVRLNSKHKATKRTNIKRKKKSK